MGLDTFLILGLALVSMCISLIQEQVARQAALMAGTQDEVVELDVIEIVPRRPNFFETDSPSQEVAAVPNVVPDTVSLTEDRPETALTLPGETNGDEEDKDDEKDEDKEEEGDEDADEGSEDEDDDDDDSEEEEEEEEEGEGEEEQNVFLWF